MQGQAPDDRHGGLQRVWSQSRRQLSSLSSRSSSMASKDSSLYGLKRHKLSSDKEIASSNSLAFSSQLSSLISNKSTTSNVRSSSKANLKPRKDDIFTTHNRSKKIKRDHEPSGSFEQKHTTDGESLDNDAWNRSKRKMEEKARLYAAMKRGDVEDADERYAVDFDKKWEEREGEDSEVSDEEDRDSDGDSNEQVEYLDEFGRMRRGTKAAAAKMARLIRREQELEKSADRFTARPAAPSNVIYGDTIQHAAFDPEAPIAEQMAKLARKRDRSLTPPTEHFDSKKEVRTKGTGFFQFSGDEEERKRQMEELERERLETERVRGERNKRMEERKRAVEERRKEIRGKRDRRQADEFLKRLGEEMAAKGDGGGVGEGAGGEDKADTQDS